VILGKSLSAASPGMTWRRAILLLTVGLAIGIIVAFRPH
jgi:hypothetical protein